MMKIEDKIILVSFIVTGTGLVAALGGVIFKFMRMIK